jgi:hypothetical protein
VFSARYSLSQLASGLFLLLSCSLLVHSQTGTLPTSYKFLTADDGANMERYFWRSDREVEIPNYRADSYSYVRDSPGDAKEDESDDYKLVLSSQPTQSAGLDLLPIFKDMDHTGEQKNPNLEDAEPIQHYHWKGLLWQSFAFFGEENAFRLMTDQYFRYLTADKPFWHDYIASLKQWNMRRWNDGDDFLVAYVGHPMQGSVTEFIEIQNDPHDRFLQLSSDRAYWKSRFKSFLWATVFSTDQKVGPLGEAALGSEGGYTYVVGCPAPCPSYQPGDKVTNNTGWVKFVSTPVVGSLWTLAEDFLDRYVSDRVQENHMDRVFPKILRGSLNPCRTMANGLRGRLPWYRDYQHPETADYLTSGVHFERDDGDSYRTLPRYEFFPHFNAFSLPVNTTSCPHGCRSFTASPGAGFSVRLTHWVDFDSDVDYLSNASPLPSTRAGGDAILGTFGLRSGFESRNYSLKASLRPGFLSYDRAYLTAPSATNPTPQIGRITHFVTSLAITGDYGIGRHFAVRASMGNTAVRYYTYYLDHVGIGKYPYLSWLSEKTFATNENWTYQAGPVVRF